MADTEAKTVAAQETKLPNYELVMILAPDSTDEAIGARMENLTKLITGSGGTVTSVDRWGKKRLAYPIKHLIEGNYILAKISMKPETSREMESNLRISEDVMRHLLVKVD